MANSPEKVMLQRRLLERFNIAIDINTFQRTRAGHYQLAEGEPSWIVGTNNRMLVGGNLPMRRYLKKNQNITLDASGGIIMLKLDEELADA